jgi:spermidine synthase
VITAAKKRIHKSNELMNDTTSARPSMLAILSFVLAFVASGAAALTYQFCWNRYLYEAIGIDLDSTSIIVATFMLGLGLGNLLGARLARLNFGIGAFVVVELMLFGFGALSPWLLEHFTSFVLNYSRAAASLALFVLLLVPTLLMGATLPLMTAAASRVPSLSRLNFSALYFYNTLGGAAGAFVSAFVLIAWLGLSRTIFAAALANLVAALLCACTIRFASSKSKLIETSASAAVDKSTHDSTFQKGFHRRALWLSALGGLIALAIEIVWMRLFGLSYHQTPWVMPFVLGSYLLGLALGVGLYRRSIKQVAMNYHQVLRWVALSFLASGAIDVLGGIAFLWIAPTGLSKVAAGFVLIVLSAASKGAILTAIADMPAPGVDNAGAWAGRVMAANIAGATLGPLLTCYVLFEWLGFQQTLSVLASLSLLIGLYALSGLQTPMRKPAAAVGAVLLSMWIIPQQLIRGILDNGGFGQDAIAQVIESRHGVFHRVKDPKGDVILGANLYDGRINVDLEDDINGIARIYRAMGSVPKIDRVLVIGLGSGSWLEAIRHFSDVKHIQVVELAPAYATLMKSSPEVAGALSDPKIRYAYTDGLRWLHRHPEQKFDLIVMNTTFYWRAFSTNLLSVEFYQQVRKHLTPEGVLMFNPTGSDDAVATFLHAFPQSEAIAGSYLGPYQSPPDLVERRVARFNTLGAFGDALLDKHGPDLYRMMASVPMDPKPHPSAHQNSVLITRDNLRSEFAVYRPFSQKHFD